MEQWKEELFAKLEIKLEVECKRLKGCIPYCTTDGAYKDNYAEKDIYWWTNGFWPGILWQMYHATGKEMYKQAA